MCVCNMYAEDQYIIYVGKKGVNFWSLENHKLINVQTTRWYNVLIMEYIDRFHISSIT